MKTILTTFAAPIYSFLSFINVKQQNGELGEKIKILDCGAGGSVPPLALFCEHDFDTWGIDISEDQLKLAQDFCVEHEMQINLQKADMRQIPFADESFDCVYEHYSMCHLCKEDTKKAISEMKRVTRKDGFAFLGMISTDSWPKSLFIDAEEHNEDVNKKNKGNDNFHCMLSDDEADELVSEWEIISKENHIKYLHAAASEITMEAWMQLYEETDKIYSRNKWQSLFKKRSNFFRYSHLFYILRNNKLELGAC